MTSWISISRILNSAYGVASVHVGPPFNVYRVTEGSTGDYVQPQNLIIANIRVDRQPMSSSDKAFEGSKDLNNFWYKLMVNGNPLQVGDVFILTNTPLNVGSVSTSFTEDEFVGFAIAEMFPTRHPIGARLNTSCQLYTSSSTPDPNGHFNTVLPNRLPIVLQNGQFGPVNSGQQAAVIPVGVMPARSYGGDIFGQTTANVPPVEKRLVYVPGLNGYQPISGDELVFANGSRYVIDSNYTQLVGAIGSLFICRKHLSGGGQ